MQNHKINKLLKNKTLKLLIGVLLIVTFIVVFVWFEASKTCPSGFIKVPGNRKFNQPGFCVSKYEMTYDDAVKPDSIGGGTDWNTMKYIIGKNVISKPLLYPIGDIIQIDAITACMNIGEGYHLITNDEWMTLARNIEQVGFNWSGNHVGNGGLYRGITGEKNTNTSLGCATNDSNGNHIRKYVSTALTIDTNKGGSNKGSDCDSKRQLKLSNGEIIWDLSGNLWEHVNKANTLDGIGYDDGINPDPCNIKDDYYDWDVCTSSGRSLYGPTTSLWTNANGIGGVRDYDGTIFTRGSYAIDGASAGIYSLCLDGAPYDTHRRVGFRCAK